MSKKRQKTDDLREVLAAKLHPRRFPGMSGKMAAIVGSIIGENWTTPSLGYLSITSDGFVTSGNNFIGSVEDLKRNIVNLIRTASLSPEETRYFVKCYNERLRPDYSGTAGIEPDLADILSPKGRRRSYNQKLTALLSKLKQVTVERGATSDEEETAKQRIKEIEKKMGR